MITKTVKNYKPIVGIKSCVGILAKEFPMIFGNYFWLNDGPYIVNMWAENLIEAVRVFNIDTIECTVFSDLKHELAFITDKRIPKNWLYNNLCVNGHGWGSRELCEACLNFAGVENRGFYCGCEKPEDKPKVMQGFSEGANRFECCKCHRVWQ